jgi:hypothetical protein
LTLDSGWKNSDPGKTSLTRNTEGNEYFFRYVSADEGGTEKDQGPDLDPI